jgi:PEP-CTERM/exosortase A-associated glycosyltransferase
MGAHSILHILDHSIPMHSGYSFRTLSILRQQRKLGWRTVHQTSWKHTAGTEAEEDVDGLHFYRTLAPHSPPPELPFVRELALMRALARRMDDVVAREKPDILHAHSPVLNALPTLWVGKRRRLPVVYEIRAFWEDAAASHGTAPAGGLSYRATRMLETCAMRQADAVTTICEGLRSDIVARGIAPRKVTIIPNAVDETLFGADIPRDHALARELDLDGAFVLGFLGSFYHYEGLHLLLEALPALLARMPNVRALLVGGGPEDEALRAQAHRLGIADKVTFIGRVSQSRVPAYASLVDLLVFPRVSMRLTDLVTPLKPLEAMAQGRLVAASDVGGHRELIRDGDTGFLFRPDDPAALAQVVQRVAALSSRQADAIRKAARCYVESERTWARSVSNYRSIYDSIAAKGRRP